MTAEAALAGDWVRRIGDRVASTNADDLSDLFCDDCSWRDLVAFSWSIVTVEGRAEVHDLLERTLPHARPHGFELDDTFGQPERHGDLVQAWLRFETAVGRGVGLVRLREGRAWTLLTAMTELRGHEEPLGPTRPRGTEHGAVRGRPTWQEERQREAEELGHVAQPFVLIVGGGQSGLALGARLRQLAVPTLIVDQEPRPGDTWRNRYEGLCLHDVVWYDHMPYLPFPPSWPIYTPKDKMGDWLEAYANIMELNCWWSTRCLSITRDETRGRWRVLVERDATETVLTPEHVVIATGLQGRPRRPDIRGADRFMGPQIHSSAFPSAKGFAGKHVIVVGSNNSAHDIAASLWAAGAEATMIQRSASLVVKSETLQELSRKALYSEEALALGVTTEKADLLFASLPHRLVPEFHAPRWRAIQEHDSEFYRRLADVGFLLSFGDDGSGLWMMNLTRAGGYYIDVGASELLINSQVALRAGVEIESLSENAVHLSDGTHLAADAIVYATGFGPLQEVVADLISPETAQQVGPVWGLGSGRYGDPGPWEGELRNMWKPTAQEGLWFHGGNLHLSRFYSHHLALQIKARFEGIPTPEYRPPSR